MIRSHEHIPILPCLRIPDRNFCDWSFTREVKPNPLFSDGAVLQRGQKIPIWGTARDGEKITVEFQGQKASTTAAGGTWSVHLDPLAAGGPCTMTLTGDNTVTIKDLLVAKDGPLKGFTIAGKDKSFVPARAEIQG